VSLRSVKHSFADTDVSTGQVFQQFHTPVNCGQYRHNWRGGGRQSPPQPWKQEIFASSPETGKLSPRLERNLRKQERTGYCCRYTP